MPDVVTASPAYRRRFAGRVGQYFLDSQDAAIAQMFRDRPFPARATVLDHGGGHNQLSGVLRRLGLRRTVSGSNEACADRLPIGTPFICGALDATMHEGMFDYVVSVRLVAHVSSVERTVAEMCRLAKRAVVIDYPPLLSLNVFSRWLYPLKAYIEGDTRPFNTIRDEVLDGYFQANGFRRTATVRQFLVPMGLHRAFRGGAVLRHVEGAARAFGLTQMFGGPAVARFERITPIVQ